VRRVDRVLTVRRIEASKGVMPFCSDRGTSRHSNDSCRERSIQGVRATVTNNVRGGHIVYRSVIGRHSDPNFVTLIDTINVELLEDGMSKCRAR